MSRFSDLKAVLINCSLVRDPQQSHTRRLFSRVAGIMDAEGVDVEVIHALQHHIEFGMVKNATDYGAERDDWPALHAKIVAADIFVLGSPIWLGVKACSMEILYSLSHIGYMIPPQADCGWIGDAGPGPSYGDLLEGSTVPAGYANDFTNRNATIMTWNLMHAARLLKDLGGFPAEGNVAEEWADVTNARDQDPDAF